MNVARLDQEIAATQETIRRHDAAGRTYQSDLASARCWGLSFARELLVPDRGAVCGHLKHQWVRKDDTGRNVWACCACGEERCT